MHSLQHILAAMVMLVMAGCSSMQMTSHDKHNPQVYNFLDHQIGHLSLDKALLHWGSPKFFTQEGTSRVAIWRSAVPKRDFGSIINRIDPVGAYRTVKGTLDTGPKDTGWELRILFDRNDVMTDWRYMEW